MKSSGVFVNGARGRAKVNRENVNWREMFNIGQLSAVESRQQRINYR